MNPSTLEFLTGAFGPHAADGIDPERTRHMRAAAQLAEQRDLPEPLIVAALLHDVGHLLPDTDRSEGHTSSHAVLGAVWLSRFAPPEVTEPVRMLVAAKRYLVGIDPSYRARLTNISLRSLEEQGGPFRGSQLVSFDRRPFAAEALTLRRVVDDAWYATGKPLPFENWLPELRRLKKPARPLAV